jgi:hypothetical protein
VSADARASETRSTRNTWPFHVPTMRSEGVGQAARPATVMPSPAWSARLKSYPVTRTPLHPAGGSDRSTARQAICRCVVVEYNTGATTSSRWAGRTAGADAPRSRSTGAA